MTGFLARGVGFFFAAVVFLGFLAFLAVIVVFFLGLGLAADFFFGFVAVLGFGFGLALALVVVVVVDAARDFFAMVAGVVCVPVDRVA